MQKQVYDLTPDDLAKNPIWIFPLDGSGDDELSVHAFDEREMPSGSIGIFRCKFVDADGRILIGYAHRDAARTVDMIRPIAWCGEVCISFWNGIVEPSKEYVNDLRRLRLSWPISCFDDALSLGELVVSLEGIYYLDGERVALVDVVR